MRKNRTILFFPFLLLLACIQHKQSAVIKNQQVTNDSLMNILTRLDSSVVDPAQKTVEIRNLYFRMPEQSKIKLARIIFDKLFYTAYAHPDSTVLLFYKQQAGLSDQYSAIKIQALLAEAAYYLYINQQVDSGLAQLTALHRYLPTFNDTLYKSYYTLYAQAMLQKGDFPKSAAYYLKTIGIAERLNDSGAIIGNYGNLAVIYSNMDQEEKAIPIKKICLDYYLKNKNNAYAFIGDVSIARSYANLNKMDSAFYYYNNALALRDSGVHNPSVEIILYTNLGEIYFERKDLKKALYYFDLCKAPLTAIGSEEQRMIYAIYSTPAYESVQKDISKEQAVMEKAIELFSKQNNLVYVKAGYYNLYVIAQKRNHLEDALQYYVRYDSVNDILAGEKNNKYVASLQARFETQKKETTIIAQQKEIERKNAYNRILILLLFSGMVSIAFIVTYGRLYRRRKDASLQQQFTTRLLERSETERSRLARDLHDGLGQNILVLKNQISNNEQIAPEKIDNLLEEVRAISRNVHPIMLDQIGLKESVIHICQQLSEKESLFISVDIDYAGELGKEKELQLFRIFQEGLNNIIKYASAEAANIQMYKEGLNIFAIIRDNGKGFDVASALIKPSSFGLLSILERSKAINGRASINSNSNGTFIKIEIPIDG